MYTGRLEPWEPGKCVLGVAEVDIELRNTTQQIRRRAPSSEIAYLTALSLTQLRTTVVKTVTDRAITNMMKETKET